MAAGAIGTTVLGACVGTGAGGGGSGALVPDATCRTGGRGVGAGCVDRFLGAAGSGATGTGAGSGSGTRSITPSDSATAAGSGTWISAAVAGGASFRRARNVPPAPTATHTIARIPAAVLVISDPLHLKPRARAVPQERPKTRRICDISRLHRPGFSGSVLDRCTQNRSLTPDTTNLT